ncbi:MAG: DUF2887 domain-containing protein, partial [Stigonema ocellatum SAG 48.90 = DSM 106950]|nr:DUF2887 domain-containing protein [Stigonema ocellatum SAG 48.90 = DSM 106950]
SRSVEQSDIHPHRTLLNGNQVNRVYLDELGDIRQLPLWVALMVLTTVKEDKAPEEARYLLGRTSVEASVPSNQVIMEMVTTIMVYKFEQLSRTEVESMLGITLKDTRVYREIKEEGREEGRSEQKAEMLKVTVPLLLKMGMSVSQIAQELNVDLEAVKKAALPQS